MRASLDSNANNFPLIGVVTPVRNRAHWTTAFVNRFARQDYPLFRHYIVDSASTDGTPDLIRKLALRSVDVIHAPFSYYWTAATNLGVRRALQEGCEFILTINDDAIIHEDFLSILVAATLKAKAPIVGSVISYAEDPHILWGVGAYNDFENGSFVQTRWGNSPEERVQQAPRETNGLLKADYLCGNGTLIHRSVFEHIGLYDERNTPHYHADSEFTMRAERAGIARFVAANARVYNRYSDDTDGPMAPKNRRFFSLRSANYIKPIIFILDRYCPVRFRTRALVAYLAPYLPTMSQRQFSMMLRIGAFLAEPSLRSTLCKRLIPGRDPAQNIIEDLKFLNALENEDFATLAVAYFMARTLNATDRRLMAKRLDSRDGRRQTLGRLTSTPQFMARSASLATFARLVIDPSRLQNRDLNAEQLTPSQVSALRKVIAERSLGDELRAKGAELLETTASFLTPSVSLAKRQGARMPAGKSHSKSVRMTPDRPVVYFNIDVLCMAELDPKAATGVYRYASAMFEKMRVDERITLRTFYSSCLVDGYRLWQSAQTSRDSLLAEADKEASANSVVFYPYFPMAESDVRMNGRPTVLTICDLFPLTNPEWFSDEAVTNFRRQLHILPAVDHFFCISDATEKQLRNVFASLRGSSSVTHLAAELPTAMEPPQTVLPRNFFLCVGTIEPRKNLKTVIEAFSRLPEDVAEGLFMVVAGQDGWRLSKAELSLLAGNKMNRILFLGRLTDSELHYCYKAARFVAFTSLAEGFGLPILESFAHGTPVITSNNSSMVEIAGDAAILVDPLDKDVLAAAISMLATDDAVRESYASRARKRAVDFSWSTCADLHIDKFIELALVRPA